MNSGYRRPFVQTAGIRPRERSDVKGYDASTYGRSFADVYDEWYHDVSDVAATVAAVAERAQGRAVLELGVGTGRIALPLAALGVAVTGVDASSEMLDRARAKCTPPQAIPGTNNPQGTNDGSVTLVQGDMAELPVEGPFAVAFVAFNTFFNLTDPVAQRRCFRRVAAVLEPGGWFAIEAFVPTDDLGPTTAPDSGVSVRTVELDRVVLTVARRDPAHQTIVGQHIEITDSGARLRPWFVRYASPGELDEMANEAGLTLAARHSDWAGGAFTDDSPNHVSWYLKATT
jgi:SAM-dependent methyltransferase